MKLSIIILNYRAEKFCSKALEALAKHPFKGEMEIILVDNGSGDGSIERLKQKWNQVRFVALSENLGYGRGNMKGVEIAKGDYLAILNPDVEVAARALDGLVAFLEAHKKAGLVGPRLFYPNNTTQDSFRRFPTFFDLIVKRVGFLRRFFGKRLQRFLLWDIDFSRPSKVDWVVGAFFVARRKAFLAAGGFDPRYFLFFEDTDLCRSLWNKGWEVWFNPLCSAVHHHKRLSDTAHPLDFLRKKTVRIHLASAFRYFWKWFWR